MTTPSRSPVSGTTLFRVAAGWIALCFLCAVAGLVQWGEREWWTRFDVFSIGALLFSALFVGQHIGFYRGLPSSRDTVAEAFGASYDPSMGVWNGLLMLAEISAVFDYGQWRLLPVLEQSALQATGLFIYAGALLLVVWSDRHLLRHFSTPPGMRAIITSGPYRYARHPRYLGLFLSRVGFALTFSSVLAWALLPAWAAVVRRRVRIEEEHLHEVFGPSYRVYARQTPRWLPFAGSERISRER